jgi:uncharacterized protein (UPF0276 family)
MKEKIEEIVKNGVLIKTPKNSICWCKWYRLIPKANGDMRLVVDMREVNQFMVQKLFKMEKTPTLEDLLRRNDFAISFDLNEAYIFPKNFFILNVYSIIFTLE